MSDDITTECDDCCNDDPVEPVYATLHFYYNDPDSMRRMRECLDAPRLKAAVAHFERLLHDQIKYGDHSQAWIDAYEQVRMDFFRIFDDHGIDIWED